MTPKNAAEFQRNWLTWRFAKGTPVLLILIGMEADGFWLPETNDSVRVVSVWDADLGKLLRDAVALCATGRVIILPTGAAAMPGAELWPNGVDFAVHGTEKAKKEMEVTDTMIVPSESFSMMRREQLAALAKTLNGAGSGIEQLTAAVHHLRDQHGNGPIAADVSELGWKFRIKSHGALSSGMVE